MSTIPHLSFSHVGLFVSDMPLMRDFYTEVLGFVLTDTGQLDTPNGVVELAFLSRDPEEHHQIVLASGRPETLHFNVVNQVSFRVPDIDALKHFHEALRRQPISDIAPVTHGNAISLYFRDPEGNRLELFMDTPWYCEQPCRESIDLTADAESIMAAAKAIARARPGFTSREAWMAKLRARLDA
ncbi:MAG: VOC family protein [Pseudomonadota bacterium]